MTGSDDRTVTVAGLREVLGLPSERPEFVRDLLAVAREPGIPIPATSAWRLALGDWPEAWRDEPDKAPSFLVMLHGLATPYFIAAVLEIEAGRWGSDADSSPEARVVPVTGTAYVAAARLAGARLDCDLTFAWPRPEEQYEFL